MDLELVLALTVAPCRLLLGKSQTWRMELKFHCDFWGRCRVEKCNKYAYERAFRRELWLTAHSKDLNNLVPTLHTKVSSSSKSSRAHHKCDVNAKKSPATQILGSLIILIKVINRPRQDLQCDLPAFALALPLSFSLTLSFCLTSDSAAGGVLKPWLN